MVIQLGLTGLEQTCFMCFQDLFEGREEKGSCRSLI